MKNELFFLAKMAVSGDMIIVPGTRMSDHVCGAPLLDPLSNPLMHYAN